MNSVTPRLDELNPQALMGPRAPNRIPPEMPEDLDGRNPDFESPATTLALLCNYLQVASAERWQVLGRVAPR